MMANIKRSLLVAFSLLLSSSSAFLIPFGGGKSASISSPSSSSVRLAGPPAASPFLLTWGSSLCRFTLYAKKGDKGKKEPAKVEIKHWDEDEDPEFILIADNKEQTTINCTAETLVVRNGKEYIIGLPIDTPVVVVDEKLSALEVGIDTRLPALLPKVESTLAEMGAKLLKTAGTLTIEGDVELYDEEGEFGDKDEEEEEDEAGNMLFVNEVDPDYADRPAPPKPGATGSSQYYDFDERDDAYMDDEEEEMDDMAEPIVDIEHEGKTYTVMKFVQPYFVVAKKNGEAWDLVVGDQAEQVFDWVLENDLDMEFDLLDNE